jgi:hypothetical protein
MVRRGARFVQARGARIESVEDVGRIKTIVAYTAMEKPSGMRPR